MDEAGWHLDVLGRHGHVQALGAVKVCRPAPTCQYRVLNRLNALAGAARFIQMLVGYAARGRLLNAVNFMSVRAQFGLSEAGKYLWVRIHQTNWAEAGEAWWQVF